MRQAAPPHEHPSPHRSRTRSTVLLTALALGPAAWALQEMLGYGVSSHACYPGDAPAGPTPTGWAGPLGFAIAAGVVFLVATAAAAILARSAWRETQGEKTGGHHELIDAGEGRSRFLALCGLLSGALFALAILADLAVVLGLRDCGTPGL